MYYTKVDESNLYTIRCIVCNKVEKYQKHCGSKKTVCTNPECEKERKKAISLAAGKKRNAAATDLYIAAHKRFNNLSYHKQRALMAAMYEEIKRSPHKVNKTFRYAMTTDYINKMQYKSGKTAKTLAQKFHSFCEYERGCTPMQIFKINKTDADIRKIIDGECNACPSRAVGKDWSRVFIPYNSQEFYDNHNTNGAIAYLLGETDEFNFSKIEDTLMVEQLPNFDDDDENSVEEVSETEIIIPSAPVIKAVKTVHGVFEWEDA